MPVVQATMVATGNKDHGKELERAMFEELKAAQAEGIFDPIILRDRMLAAHARKKAELES